MVAQQDTTIVGENASKTMLMMMIKGKRSKRSRLSSPSSLTMSTTSATDEAGSSVSDVWTPAAASEEEQDMARCLILLARGTPPPKNNNNNNNNSNGTMSYECKTCNRTFPSFQALGGHRTSHKKPKLTDVVTTQEQKKPSLTFSIVSDGSNNQIDQSNDDDGLSLMLQMGSASVTTHKGKVHECSICGAEFSSGQALGGHMRRHRPIASAVKMAVTTGQEAIPKNGFSLDLNLPAPEEDYSSKFVFPSNEKTLVFTASSLVDCHY